MKSKRALLITGVPSPFHVELAEAITYGDSEWVMDVIFIRPLISIRGPHWLTAIESPCSYFTNNPIQSGKNTTIRDLIEIHHYDVVIEGLEIKPVLFSQLQDVIQKNIPIIHWSEKPVPRGWIKDRLKEVFYRRILKKLDPVAIFAMGDRGVDAYRAVYEGPVHSVPYFQNLEFAEKRNGSGVSRNEGRINFLFSGSLIPRNNIQNILEASRRLIADGYGERFKVTFFGKGELLDDVAAMVDKYPAVFQLWDCPIEHWSDRMSPIKACDVLLSPGNYSGWGLTIPEALALGKPVISTIEIESARYFIRDGINGFFSGQKPDEIAAAMRLFINHSEIIDEMYHDCIDSAFAGSTGGGERVFSRLLSEMLD